MSNTPLISLGNIAPEEFLQEYWQKKPLLVRNAFPGFNGLLSPSELQKLACYEDVQSRLVIKQKNQWKLKHGPFRSSDFKKLSDTHWTLLVQEVNHYLPSARDLLSQFRFIPHARLDDLMVSYAPQGGGVGPHFDSYDVFLLQGLGERRWQISAQQDHEWVAEAPLKILKHFQPEQEWILHAGDMLYLPPHYAHNGIAENDCMTYSIGFRAPSHQELIEQFLIYLQDHSQIEGQYADPELQLQQHPSQISLSMQQQTRDIVKKIQWSENTVEDFLGRYLSEPKSHVFFDPPDKPITQHQFKKHLQKNGVTLSLKSRMLTGNNRIFMNGDSYTISDDAFQMLRNLADHHMLSAPLLVDEETEVLLYQWYIDGYLE